MEKNNLPNFRDIDTKNILSELNYLIELARSSLEEAIKKKTFTYDSLVVLREENLILHKKELVSDKYFIPVALHLV